MRQHSEATSKARFDGSCDVCLHFRSPLHDTGDWYDGPILACAECLRGADSSACGQPTSTTADSGSSSEQVQP